MTRQVADAIAEARSLGYWRLMREKHPGVTIYLRRDGMNHVVRYPVKDPTPNFTDEELEHRMEEVIDRMGLSPGETSRRAMTIYTSSETGRLFWDWVKGDKEVPRDEFVEDPA